MTTEEARREYEVVLGTFLVNDLPNMVLFDVGAGRLFVSPIFYAQFVIPRSLLHPLIEIEVVIRSYVLVREKFSGFFIVISSHTFPRTLILIGIKYFDVFLGMDWLSVNWDDIIRYEKYVHIKRVEGGNIIARGQKSMGFMPIIYVMKAHKCLMRGCEVLLAHTI